MPSRLTIAQTHLHDARTKLTSLEAKNRDLLAEGSTATMEDMEAHATAIDAARQEVETAAREVTATQRLADLDSTASAVIASTSDRRDDRRELLTATPGFERDPMWGFKSTGHFAQSVFRFQSCAKHSQPMPTALQEQFSFITRATHAFLAQEDAELKARGFSSSFNADDSFREGYTQDGLMVPPEVRQTIWVPTYETSDLLPLFAPETSSAAAIDFLADETTPWGAAGIIPYWLAEVEQLKTSRFPTEPRSARMQKIGVMVIGSNEIMADAPLLTSRINEKVPLAMGYKIVDAFIRGNGAGKPLGYEAASYKGMVVVPKSTSQRAATINAENITNMYARLLEGPGGRSRWIAHRSDVPQFVGLKIGNEPSWTAQNQGLKDAPSGMLLGTPIVFTQHAKALGAQGDLSLINFAGYSAFVHSSGTRFDASMHLYFDFDKFAWRFISRVAGLPLLSTPQIPEDGGSDNSLSYFVQLAVRA
jgi:HK97 family phage major capsid protein